MVLNGLFIFVIKYIKISNFYNISDVCKNEWIIRRDRENRGINEGGKGRGL